MNEPVQFLVPSGALVRDPVTGIEGIVTCRSTHLTGCNRLGIQPKAAEEAPHKVPEMHWCDETLVEVIEALALDVSTRARILDGDAGGPAPAPRGAQDPPA